MYFTPTLPRQTTESFRIRKWYVFSIQYLSESERERDKEGVGEMIAIPY